MVAPLGKIWIFYMLTKYGSFYRELSINNRKDLKMVKCFLIWLS
jgi:hypothetical protein